MTGEPLAAQRAIVTGGASGIGAAIVQAFAKAGAAVLINHHGDAEAARAAAAGIVKTGGRALAAAGDVSRPGEVARLFDLTDEHFGGVDIVVINAGLQKDGLIAELTVEDWRAAIEVDLTGAFLCAQEAIRRFRRQGLDPRRSAALGKIVFISSVHEAIPWAGHVNYAAAKGGARMLMRSLAQEVAREKIRVNAIAPGAIRTPINRAAWATPAARRKLLKLIPYGRIGEADDVARAAVWLASDASDYAVGTTLFIDGGMSLYPSFADGG